MQQFDVVRFLPSFALLLVLIASCDGRGSTTFNGPGPVDTAAPTVPQNLNASANVEAQIELDWDESTDAGDSGLIGYTIYRDGGATPIGSTPNSNYSDTGLSANPE